MQRATITVKGKVQMVGFRGFVEERMKSLGLKGFANNLPDGTVEVVCEGKKERIEELITKIKEKPPHFTKVDSVKIEWQEYISDLKEPERRGEDIPKKGATLDDLLVVMKSFDKKAEVLNERVGDVASNTENIASTLKEFKKESGEKQDQMLEKQDKTIEVLGGKIDSVGMKVDTVGEKVDQGFTKTDVDFQTLREDYGKMSDKMDSIDKTLKELTKAILKLAKKSKGK